MNYTTYRANLNDLIGLYCNCTRENVKLISNKYNFWELGELDNYIPYNDYIVIYRSGNAIECRMIKKDPTKEPSPHQHNIKDYKFISDEDLKLLIDGPLPKTKKIQITLELEVPEYNTLEDVSDILIDRIKEFNPKKELISFKWVEQKEN